MWSVGSANDPENDISNRKLDKPCRAAVRSCIHAKDKGTSIFTLRPH